MRIGVASVQCHARLRPLSSHTALEDMKRIPPTLASRTTWVIRTRSISRTYCTVRIKDDKESVFSNVMHVLPALSDADLPLWNWLRVMYTHIGNARFTSAHPWCSFASHAYSSWCTTRHILYVKLYRGRFESTSSIATILGENVLTKRQKWDLHIQLMLQSPIS